MSDLDSKANTWEVEWLQEQIYELWGSVRKLEYTVDRLNERLNSLEERLTDDGK